MGKPMSSTTRSLIKATFEAYFEDWVRRSRDAKSSLPGKPEARVRGKSPMGVAETTCSITTGSDFFPTDQSRREFSAHVLPAFEEIARLVAVDFHDCAVRNYSITGEVRGSAIDEIEHQVSAYESLATGKGSKPSFSAMVEAVLSANDGPKLTRSSAVDLFVRKRDGTEVYFEIKSPYPGRPQCLELTRRLLRTHLIRNARCPRVQAYFAMAYNPYGPDRADYKWPYALNYMPFDQVVLIGQEFWSMVGGPSTYLEVLDIYQEVGKEKGKYIVDALAFGF